jgi:hypothetical protein
VRAADVHARRAVHAELSAAAAAAVLRRGPGLLRNQGNNCGPIYVNP